MANRKIQRGSRNVAGNGDRVAVQVGQISPAGDRDRTSRRQPLPTPPEAVDSENIRTGNATVGEQADVIVGDIRF